MATRVKTKLADAPAKARVRVKLEAATDDDLVAPSYFASGYDKAGLKFVSTGCSVLDEALGGGYVLGRVANVVGDRSSGKTLQAMEVAANFLLQYSNGWVRYGEAEAAFDQPYAEALGFPIDRITFNPGGKPLETVEEVYDDLVATLDKNKGRPGIYIIDSLDALSDEAELGRSFNEGSFGGAKPKAIGKLFRMLTGRLEEQEVLLLVVSQLRDKLNVTFGETKTRSGGRALDFYATHIVWLAEIKKLKRTVQKIDRIVGVDVEAYVKKNKVGLAFRRARYPILFGYGVDDLTAGVEWLIDNHRESYLEELGMSKSGYALKITSLRNKGGEEVNAFRARLREIIRTEWAAIETTFLPKAKKY